MSSKAQLPNHTNVCSYNSYSMSMSLPFQPSDSHSTHCRFNRFILAMSFVETGQTRFGFLFHVRSLECHPSKDRPTNFNVRFQNDRSITMFTAQCYYIFTQMQIYNHLYLAKQQHTNTNSLSRIRLRHSFSAMVVVGLAGSCLCASQSVFDLM